jgi:hypothetical protein
MAMLRLSNAPAPPGLSAERRRPGAGLAWAAMGVAVLGVGLGGAGLGRVSQFGGAHAGVNDCTGQ